MIRTDTTLIVGAGANREIEMPDGPDLLSKIAGGFEFERLDSEVKSRDLVNFSILFQRVAGELDMTYDELVAGAMAIRDATLVSTSIDAILEQYGHDPAVLAAGKLAIVYYTLQGESKSTMAVEPRASGELPLRGTDNWLFQLGQLIVKGVPRARAEEAFEKLSIVCFNYDRAIEHYLPWVVQRAFGMTIDEANELVANRLRIVHPYGVVGRLPWQGDEEYGAVWGDTDPDNIVRLSKRIYTASQRANSRQFQSYLRSEMSRGKRLGFLGFGFDPMNVAMLFDQLEHDNPDMLVSLVDISPTQQKAILRLIYRLTGIEDESRITLENMKASELLRDYGRFLES
ncbi:MAG: SIR2 family protein [Erythrobacter sp.]|uniref:SIR2 family protein n=1 Tax=Erythrobacter sp. Alg231-14 TaxID=1922225 RepID=UPI000D556DD4